MSRRVWVIEQGQYSDYRVVGVFSSRENAETVLAKLKKSKWDHPEIVEWEMDPGIDAIHQGLRPFHVVMSVDGTVEKAEEDEWSSYNIEGRCWLWERTKAPAYRGQADVTDAVNATVFARDAEHAIKIVNERRVQMLAEPQADGTP